MKIGIEWANGPARLRNGVSTRSCPLTVWFGDTRNEEHCQLTSCLDFFCMHG
jgi:hypothetical protein